MKLLILIIFGAVALALIIGAARRRGIISQAADKSFVSLANAARYFLYIATTVVVVFAVALLLQL